jgi:hypothetical protein
MSRVAWSRRSVLRGLGGALVGLPMLEALEPGFAEAQTAPKRLVIVTTPNGTNPATHWPSGTTKNFTLSPILSPLAAYKDNLVVLRGVDNRAASATGINGHTDTVRCMLTGRAASNNSNDDYTAAGGVSVDQHIANEIGADTAFKSLEYVTSYIYEHPPNYCSFYGANQPAPFEDEPAELFKRVFGEFTAPADDPAAIARREDNQSVLHAVYDNYKAVDKRLGAADRARLAAHLQMVEDLEQKLLKGVSAECVVPEAPVDDENDADVGIDILVHALACDLTRVATIRTNFWDSYSQFGVTGSYHDDYLHNVTSDPDAAQMVDQVKTYQAGQVAAILDKLAAVSEGTGTLLDSTLVLWVDEFCHGYAHAHNEVPYVLVSGADRFFEMGRSIHYTSAVSTNQLLNSLIQVMGASGAGQFGDPEFDNTPLSELV